MPVFRNTCSYNDIFTRRLLENYCFVLLTNKAPPQISDNRPDMRHRALFVTSRAYNECSVKGSRQEDVF